MPRDAAELTDGADHRVGSTLVVRIGDLPTALDEVHQEGHAVDEGRLGEDLSLLAQLGQDDELGIGADDTGTASHTHLVGVQVPERLQVRRQFRSREPRSQRLRSGSLHEMVDGPLGVRF